MAASVSSPMPSANDVRVITTIGHVDHGKTTFVDYLLAANNIISPRLAGKIRYLDSREDEQERGITMESSAVSLHFKALGGQGKDGSVQADRTYSINLIDTPGHVDFSGEVSSASRLCDGALVLVDVVEGVCTQTITVLRQAYLDKVRPVLVLNKMDRLITELKLAPIEAHLHLVQLVEQVNAVMGAFFAGERMEDDLRWREERERRLRARKEKAADATFDGATNDEIDDDNAAFQERDDEDLYFAPERGNVIFASALDGWGFRVTKFAQLYASKLGMREGNLRKVLWGDYYLDPKTKRVIGHKHLKGRALKPLFVQFVLENVWRVYEVVMMNPDPDKVIRIVNTLGLKISSRDLNSRDTRHLLTLIFAQWLSLSTATIQAVIDIVPPPPVAQRTRIPMILHPERNTNITSKVLLEPENKLERDMYGCESGDAACVVAYVSKTFAVESKDLPERKKKPLTAQEMRERAREVREERALGVERPSQTQQSASDPYVSEMQPDTTILAFARLYSGTLKSGQCVYAILPKYNSALSPTHPRNVEHVIRAQVDGLYIMMGRELEPVEQIHAGNVFAMRGLEGKIWRVGTLCAPPGGVRSEDGNYVNGAVDSDREWLINMGGVSKQTTSIVRIALEPADPADLPKLVEGLKLLRQADPAVETFQQQTGEHVILTAGEIHFERCLKDLKERFAKIEIQASDPIVPYRETAIKVSQMAPPKTLNALRGTVHGSSAHDVVKFTIRAAPMPPALLTFLQDNLTVVRRLLHERIRREEGSSPDRSAIIELEDEGNGFDDSVDIYGDVIKRPTTRPDNFWTSLESVCGKLPSELANLADRIWAFGPHSAGGCILVDAREGGPSSSLRRRMRRVDVADPAMKEKERVAQQFENSIETGFQLGTSRGPLCAEPVEGMMYFVEKMEYDVGAAEAEQAQNRMPQVIGSLITSVQESCRSGLLDWSPRLMLAMYSCDIQASTDVLGKVYGVVAKRRGRIVSEEMKEGTSFFTVTALFPVVESFGFAVEIRTRTSGAASPQLIFNGYEMLDQDPFWVPTTEEELEDLGEKADRENVAKVYMDRVRERKGMFVDKKIVEFAEKQRTLKR